MVKVRSVKTSSNFAGKVPSAGFMETFRFPGLKLYVLVGGAKDRGFKCSKESLLRRDAS